METPNARASPGGSLASRRQKNLKKFRLHKEAQRQAGEASPQPTKKSVEIKEVSAAAVEPKPLPSVPTAAVEPTKAMAVAVEPKQQEDSSKHVINDDEDKINNSAVTARPQTPPPALPLVGGSKKEPSVSQSPRTQKRRSDIMRKLHKRNNRGSSAERSKKAREAKPQQSRHEESAPTTTPAVMTDATNNSKAGMGNNQEVVTAEVTNSKGITTQDNEPKQDSELEQIENTDTKDNKEIDIIPDSEEVSSIADTRPQETIEKEKEDMTEVICVVPLFEEAEDIEEVKLVVPLFGSELVVTESDGNDEEMEIIDSVVDPPPTDATNDATSDEVTETDAIRDESDLVIESDGNEETEISDSVVGPPPTEATVDQVEETDKAAGERDEKKEILDAISDESDVVTENDGDEYMEISDSAEPPPTKADADPTVDQVEEKDNAASEADEQEETVDTTYGDESHLCEPSTSFDLRSIHDFPPEPVKTADAALPSNDPSWDTAKVIFNEFEQSTSFSKSKAEGDGSLNMFDTDAQATAWTVADSVAFSQDFQTDSGDFAEEATGTTSVRTFNMNSFFGQEVIEEKKELDAAEEQANVDTTSTTEDVLVELAGSEESNLSPRRRMSRMQVNTTSEAFGFDVSNLAMDSTDELDYFVSNSEEEDGENSDETKVEAPEKDDEGLLDKKADDDSDRDLWRNNSQLSKEERLEQYTSPNKDDGDNSSVGSSDEEEEDDESFNEELPEVGYMSHCEEEILDDMMEEQRPESELEKMPIEIVEDAPAFVIPTEAAVAAQSEPEVAERADSLDIVAISSSAEADDSAGGAPRSPAVDPMQSISASSSEGNEAAPGGLTADVETATASIGEEGVTEAAAGTDLIAVGYFSHSSSSGSTSSDDQEASKRTKLEKEAEEVVTTANVETVGDQVDDPNGSTEGSAACEQTTSGPSDCVDKGKVEPSEKPRSESGEVEESLVGISLVPSWGTNSNRKNGSSSPKAGAGLGIPPKSSASPSMLPPPPPPPLSKKKRKKKRKGSSKKAVPLLAPPPEEKLKKWEESKNRAAVYFSETQKSKSREAEDTDNSSASKAGASSSAARRRPDIEPIVCGAGVAETESWEKPPESPGRISIACGGLIPDRGPWTSFPKGESDQGPSESGRLDCGGALAMAGLTVSPQKKSEQGPQLASNLSPVDAARSIALGNAMRRANEGFSARYNFSPPTSGKVEDKSLLENEMVASTSTNSSTKMEETRSQPSCEAGGVEEPPVLTRKQMSGDVVCESFPDSPHAFLQKLTSPSLSMSSPTNDKGYSSSPLIHDSKMAEKAALASYAAARTFEEQYVASQGTNETRSFDGDEADDLSESNELPSLFCAPEIGQNLGTVAAGEEGIFFGAKFEQELTGIIEEKSGIFKDLVTRSTPSRESSKDGDGASKIQDLQGGAFSPWKNAVYARSVEPIRSDSSSVQVAVLTLSSSSSSDATEKSVTLTRSNQEKKISPGELLKIHQWLTYEVLKLTSEKNIHCSSDDVVRQHLVSLLENSGNLNTLCGYVTDKINMKIEFENEERAERNACLSPRKKMKPFVLGRVSGQKSSSVVAANFVSFMHRISKVSGTPSPFGEDNPFLLDLISTSIYEGNQEGKLSTNKGGDDATMQCVVFRLCPADVIVKFTAQVCGFLAVGDSETSGGVVENKASGGSSFDLVEASRAANPSPTKKSKGEFFGVAFPTESDRKLIVADEHPSPFESAMKQDPKIMFAILENLGDPACVCRLKMVNRDCHKFITQNEQILMRDAVRLGGLSMNLRPSFWLWVTLEKCGNGVPPAGEETDSENKLSRLEEAGRTGKWHNVIQRDVARSFGNMPPHKTGARLRTDSIVRALVTWGKNRIMKQGVKGSGNPPPSGGQASLDCASSESDASQTPTDTVSDWGGVSPVASFTGSFNGDDKNSSHNEAGKSGASRRPSRDSSSSIATELLVLSGNALTEEMKADLQGKLGYILHTLAATHEVVGYCQGMDYIVAHLLRILQDTIQWRAAHGTLPASILSAPTQEDLQDNDVDSLSQNLMEGVEKTLVVEETVFKVMDSLFTTYNLQHMYWPELRCLKTCCRVFERLIQLKLPVLADHFEHHELNVGLFALGWFQTLFLYLPSMPSATVCHMWDIWLVERSFKIFFRVGTAILFLSQPILLNHELEGMMTYLNTFPDATLLNPDILIACALQIKVTNKMLMEIETEVGGSN